MALLLNANDSVNRSYTITKPSPNHPLDVNGVGERTENLYNSSETSWEVGILDDQGHNTGSTTSHFTKNLTRVSPNTDYFLSGTIYVGVSGHRIYFYDNSKNWISRSELIEYNNGRFTTPSNCAYIQIQVAIDVNSTSDWMLSTGSIVKPYEPYGYKIPISSGGVTANIYLGSTQSTRQIKKLVLDGTEDWTYEATYSRFYISVDDYSSLGLRATPFLSNAFCSVSDGRPITDVPDNTIYSSSTGYDVHKIYIKCTSYTSADDFKAYLAQQYTAGTPVTVWYVLAEPTTGIVNEPLMKIGTYADTLSNAAQIPTAEGANTITVDTAVQPSEFTATWTGWHNASVKEYEGGVGNNKFDEQYPDIKFDVTYRPLYVGSGGFTCTSTCPQSQYGAQLFILAGNVSSGASTNTNGVWNGAVRSVTAVDGYVTIVYRNAGGVSPSDYDTMLNAGSTALPYEPYEYGWE